MPTHSCADQPFPDGDQSAIETGHRVFGPADYCTEDDEPNAARGILLGMVISVPLWIVGLLAFWSI